MSKSHMLAAVAGAAIASALAGGVAWATIPGDGGVIQGCYTKVGGILRVVDTAKGERCLGIESPISWNQKGLKGDPGANGAPGVSPAVAQLQPGDAHCPAGGAAITAADGSTAYACNGTNGTNGQSFAGTFTSPNGEYSINVTDAGITVSHGPATFFRLVGDDLVLHSGDDFDVTSGQGIELRAGTSANVLTGADFSLSSGQSIGLQAMTSATVLAGTNFSLKGSGTGLVQSTGVLSLKGSAVNVN